MAGTAQTPPKEIGLNKLGQLRNEQPAVYQMLQEIQSKVSTYIVSRPAGRATLIAGAAVVLEPKTLPGSLIQLTVEKVGGTPGTLSAPVSGRVTSKSFTIQSSSGTDTSTVVYQLTNL